MWKNFVASIALLGMLTASAHGQGLGFGVHGGYITGFTNESLEQSIRSNINDFELRKNMPDLGVHLDITAMRSVGFDLFLDYAWKTQAVIGDLKVRHAIASLTGSVKVGFPILVITPYVGGGLGFYRTVQSITSGDTAGVILPSDRNRGGWHAKLGLALNPPEFPVIPFLEWRYSNINMPGDDIKYNSVVLGITLGASK